MSENFIFKSCSTFKLRVTDMVNNESNPSFFCTIINMYYNYFNASWLKINNVVNCMILQDLVLHPVHVIKFKFTISLLRPSISTKDC